MQSLRSPDAPSRHAPGRGGAHRRPEIGKTRWWVVAAATLLLVTGAGLATAELTITPADSRDVADTGNSAPESIGELDSTSSTRADEMDKGDKPTPSKTKESKSEKPTEDDEETSTEPVDEFAGLRDGVVKLVNEERASAGCGKVSSNAKLGAAATGHSKDMAANNYFDHTSQDGRTFTDRAGAQGYDAAIGENIAYGQTSADAVMDAWMNSDGHRANILNCDAKAIGMGVAEKGDGTLYWTQMFGSQ